MRFIYSHRHLLHYPHSSTKFTHHLSLPTYTVSHAVSRADGTFLHLHIIFSVSLSYELSKFLDLDPQGEKSGNTVCMNTPFTSPNAG